jgi:hypothetical protein
MQLAPLDCMVRALAVDTTSVYALCAPHSVEATPIAGGVMTAIATAAFTFEEWDGLATDGSSVFVAADSKPGVQQVPVGGGAPNPLVDDATNGALALGPDAVYFTTATKVEVAKKVPGSSLPGAFNYTGPRPAYVAVDTAHLYFTDDQAGVVMMSSLAQPSATPTTLASGVSPWLLAADGTAVYWIDNALGRVMKVPIAGGAPVALTAKRNAAGLAVDATSVYWIDGNAGTLMKAPK